MTSTQDTHDTSNTVFTVHVQRRDVTFDIDDYVIEGGSRPLVETNDAQELIVVKRDANNETETPVVRYAHGCWLRVWVEES
jgi:hypothetical protein